MVFLTKTTVLTSILTSEVTDMVPQPQFELGKVPGTQSGTWGNLVPHMCKSHQTTSVNVINVFFLCVDDILKKDPSLAVLFHTFFLILILSHISSHTPMISQDILQTFC